MRTLAEAPSPLCCTDPHTQNTAAHGKLGLVARPASLRALWAPSPRPPVSPLDGARDRQGSTIGRRAPNRRGLARSRRPGNARASLLKR